MHENNLVANLVCDRGFSYGQRRVIIRVIIIVLDNLDLYAAVYSLSTTEFMDNYAARILNSFNIFYAFETFCKWRECFGI